MTDGDITHTIACSSSDSLYLGTAIVGLVDIPGDFFGARIMDKYGRKRTVTMFLLGWVRKKQTCVSIGTKYLVQVRPIKM